MATATDSKGNTSEFSAAIDIAVKLPVGLDFSDAPNSYHTLLASDGPRHSLGAGPVLGKAITADADGKPSSTAAGDSGDDGVTLPTCLIAGLDAVATVIASAPGRLDAWIDFNRNGVFNANEQIAASLPVVAGANTVKFAVPLNAVGGAEFCPLSH